MADNLGYTTLTHYIPIEVFLALIRDDIKKLIHTYGHKNCGLRHEELCEEIKKVIPEKRKIVFKIMDAPGRKKWSNDWNSIKNEFFNKLFENEGFTNMCYPYKKLGNESLYQLKSKHIDFCKKKDVWRAAVEKNNEYNECVIYNSWIIAETKKLTLEFLRNVKISNLQTVKKYFSTKTQPEGYDPRDTYSKSKLDCTKYNPPTSSHSQKPTTTRPPNSLRPPTAHDVKHESQRKGGSSLPGRDGGIEITKNHVKKHPQAEHSASNSQTYSLTNTKVDGTPNIQHTDLKPKGPGTSVNKDDKKKESTPIQGQAPANNPSTTQAEAPPLPSKDTSPTSAIQIVPAPTATTSSFSTLTTVKNTTYSQTPVTSPSLTITSDSSLNSGSPLPSNLLPPVAETKSQDRSPQFSTTSDTHATTHPNQSVPSTTPADSSLPQPQAPVLTAPPAVTTAKESGTPSSSSASTITTTVTTTTESPTTVTISTMSTTQHPISSLNQTPGINGSQEPPPLQVASEPKATAPNKELKQTVIQAPTSLSGTDTKGVLVPIKPEHKDTRLKSGAQLTNDTSQTLGQKPDKDVVSAEDKLQRTIDHTDSVHSISPDQIGTRNGNDQLTHRVNAHPGKIPDVKSGKDLNSNPVTQKGKNDNPNFIPEEIPSLTHIIPTLLVILAIFTLLYQLYKVK
ncbi:STP1 protein [Plasmodium ovale]|uniref:STP1 protein n=1 Tax=Plasmodium ovale TaxID=36330 RepID=A0A1D3JDQ0_PLAOA|nr:STP1 protein [Plasmodium ovale]